VLFFLTFFSILNIPLSGESQNHCFMRSSFAALLRVNNTRAPFSITSFVVHQHKLLTKSLCCLLLAMTLFVQGAWGQTITVTITGGSNTTPALNSSYSSFASFVTALNSITAVAGPVTATLTAGASETAPIKGFNISTSTANVFNTTNTLTIVKAAGAATTINAGVGTSASPAASSDGMMYLSGMDGVTIDGITFTDGNSANATVAMEFGIALFKRSTGDGCNNNTIQNCTFNMQRTSNGSGTAPMGDGSIAIIVMNSTAAANTTILTPTNGGTLASNGTNSNNKFYNNTINGGNAGIYLSGYLATSGVGPSPTATTFLGDLNNDIGGTISSTGNTILNFGGGAATNAAVGIRANNQWSVNISYNTVNNNNGSGVNHATTLRGIYAQAGTSGNATINNNTVSIQSGATTSACTAIDNLIGSTAASNTVTINNNTVNIGYSTATTGVYTAISNTAIAATVNINSNTIGQISSVALSGTGTHVMIETGSPSNVTTNNNTINNITRNGASGSWRGIKTTSPTNWTANSNTISNISWSTPTSTGSFDGIFSSSSAVNVTSNNNNIFNISTPTTGTLRGIYEFGISGNKTFQGNQIYNFSTTSGGAGGATFLGINSNTGTVDISDNTIYSFNSTGSSGGSGGAITGISTSSSGTNAIYNNKLFDLSTSSTNPVVTGIVASAGATNTVYNNIIGDLRATAANAANAVRGLNLSGGTTVSASFNSIYLNASSTGALFSSSGIFFSTTPTITLRNNMVVNLSSFAGAANTAALRRTSGTAATIPSNYSTSSNNNMFYAGTPGAGNLIYTEGTTTTFTNSQQTLAGYKTFMSTRDQASASENPTFQSTTGSNANFLKYNTSIATQLESGGVTVSGITTDYAGTTRNATTPDIGAWELAGIAADLTSPGITYTALGNTLCTSGPTLSVNITDASGVNTTAGTAPRIYYKKSVDDNAFVGNTSADNGWKFVESTTGSSPFSFTLNGALLRSAIAAGDVIQYFVVAQDNATTPNVGINSGTYSNTSALTSVSITSGSMTGTINSYSIVTAIPNSVTIGAAGTYSTVTGTGGLFEAINSGGLSANTVATIIDASVTETGAVALNQINYGCSGAVTLTIKPQTTATLSGSSSTALITLNEADNVIIDGSNNGTSSRDLTIINNNTGTSSAVVWLQSNGTNGATSNIIKNCNIVGNAPTTTLVGVGSGSSSISATSLGTNNNNNTFQNNNISKVQYAIYSQGNSSGTKNSGNVITQNLINTASPNQVLRSGILVGFEDNVTISSNNISNISGVSSGDAWAISIGAITSISTTPPTSGNEVTNATVSANLIGSIRGANAYSAGGILVSPSTSGINLIVNNMISDVAANGTGGDCGIGIMVAGGSGSTTRIYHNSVAMSATLTGGTGPNIALAVSNNPVIDIKNNILASTGSTGTGANRAIALSYSTYTNLTSNYNDLFVSGGGTTAGVGAIGGWVGTAQVALSNWQTTTSQDVNSLSIVPPFVSATDLHLSTGTTPTRFESRGVLTSVTTDIDGQVRPGPTGSTNGGGTAPDIGADEFDGVPIPGCVTPTAQPTGLVLTPATSSISLSFTPAAGTPSNYLIIRYTGATISTTTPVNGTTYTNGTSALGGIVVANSTTSTVNDEGPLSPTTQYTYAIYSYNNSSCDGGPIYLTASPLTGTTTTCGNAAPSSAAATAVLATSFVANWTAVTGSTGYLLDVSTSSTFSSFVTGYNSLAVSSSSLSLTVTGLTPLTTYYYRVRSQEGTCVSTNSGNITVTTYASVPWSEGFTGSTATPAGWTLSLVGSSTSEGWYIGSARGAIGNSANSVYMNFYDAVGARTGTVTLPAFAAIPPNVTLNYQYSLTNYTSPYGDPGNSWGNMQWQISVDQNTFTNIGAAITATTGATYIAGPSIDLSPYAGQNIQLRVNATWVAGDYDLSFDNFNIFPPCTVPASPTGLTQSSSGLTSIALGFTHPGTAPSSYLVVRYPAGSTPTSPVTGTTYAVNGTLGSGVVTHIITGTSTPTFTLSNLNPGTSYEVYVYPYNNTNCSPAPLYGGPLSGTFTTVSCAANPLVGSYSIPGSYASLTAAISDLNVRGVSGNVFLQLGSAYTSTVETFPLTLASNPCMNASNTVTIRPAAGVSGLSITSGNATTTIDVNGGDYWIVDGRPGSIGSRDMIVENTSTSGTAIRFINDASNNTIRHTVVRGVNTSTSSGVVLFSNTTESNGNDNNTIDYCDIRDGSTTPTNGIYSLGTTTTATHNNSGNTISNCNIFNFYSSTTTSQMCGVLLSNGNTDWNIIDNSFYQTATRTTFGNTVEFNAIRISNSSGNNFVITGNYVGGAQEQCGGAALTLNTSATLVFRAIQLTVGAITATSLQNNTVRNIAITTASTSTS
jgi:hypothetical protein